MEASKSTVYSKGERTLEWLYDHVMSMRHHPEREAGNMPKFGETGRPMPQYAHTQSDNPGESLDVP